MEATAIEGMGLNFVIILGRAKEIIIPEPISIIVAKPIALGLILFMVSSAGNITAFIPVAVAKMKMLRNSNFKFPIIFRSLIVCFGII